MKPSIGRIVHYFADDSDLPHAAIVTRVHSEQCVDLHVWSQEGTQFGMTSVPNYPGGPRWEWPPRV